MSSGQIIALNEREVELLRRALDAYLEHIARQAERPDQRAVRFDLWEFERELERLRLRLDAISPPSEPPPPVVVGLAP
jgi:hypothetical protein